MSNAIEIESDHTIHAARAYMTAAPDVEPAHCLFLAAKMYESVPPGLEFAEEELGEHTSSGHFTADEHAVAEIAVLKAMDYMLWTAGPTGAEPVGDAKKRKKRK